MNSPPKFALGEVVIARNYVDNRVERKEINLEWKTTIIGIKFEGCWCYQISNHGPTAVHSEGPGGWYTERKFRKV